MKRWAIVLLVLTMLTAGATLAYGQSAAGPAQLGIDLVTSEHYPEVTFAITLPSEMLVEDGATPTFAITENGRPLTVLATDAESATRVPQDVVLLIDTSGSMAGDPLEDAKAAARGFLNQLSADDRVALVSFAFKPTVVSSFTSDRTALLAAIDGLQASGETAVHDAIVSAAGLVAQSDRQVTLVLLSDGGDTVSVNTFDNAVGAVKAAGVPVFAVALESGEWDPQALQTLATASGGRYLATADSRELTALYEGIARELTSRYLVTFTSLAPNTKDLDIAVTATVGDQIASAGTVIGNPLYASIATSAPAPIVATMPPKWRSSLVVVLLFAAVAGFVGSIGLMLIRPKASLDRLDFYDQAAGARGAADATPGSPAALKGKLVDAVGYVAGRSGFTKALHSKLEQAGLPLRPNEYIYLHLLGVLIVGLLSALLTGSFALSMFVVVLAIAIPLLLLENRIEKRRAKFEEQLPELLNLVAGSLRAGWGMLQSVALVVEQMPAPASDEFRRVQTEARLGLSVEEALENMADRLQSEDFRWTVTAISIQREVGGNLAEVLDIVSSTMRDRAELRRHIRGLTAEGRISGVILMALPFVELAALTLANPTYLGTMFEHPFGWFLTLMGVLLLIVGGIWLRRAMAVEV